MVPDPAFAQGYAARAHMRQKYGSEPYMVHVGQVVDIVKRHNFTSPLIIEAAWLHDVLEDTETTRWDLGAVFDPLVVSTVWCVTGVGKTRRERNESIYLKAKHNEWATAIKVADRIANMRYSYDHNQRKMLQMYLKEYGDFSRALGVGVTNELRPLWKELDSLYNEIVHWGSRD